MRVATQTKYDLITYNLSNITDKLADASEVVSSGKRINELSDDPTGITQALGIKSALANFDQMDRNINLGESWLVVAEGALGHAQNLVSDAKVLCIEMASAAKSTEDRQAAVSIVQNELEEMITLANTQLSGRYIFSGSETDTKPFELNGDYNGNDTPFAIKTGNNSLVQIGHYGDAIFGDIFDTLNDLMTALQSDDDDIAIAGINTSMDSLDTHFEDISSSITDVGSKMNRMEIKKNILQTMTISNRVRLSQIEDADIIEAAINLSSIEMAYQAALASSASMMELSLVDFMR